MKCVICNRPIKQGEKTHLDHILPRSLGGEDVEFNLRVAHAQCNMMRHNWADDAQIPLMMGKRAYPPRPGARVQLDVAEDERDRWVACAEAEGLSLTAWMKRAMAEKLEAEPA